MQNRRSIIQNTFCPLKVVLFACLVLPISLQAQNQETPSAGNATASASAPQDKTKPDLLQNDFSKLPTYIKSDSLTLRSEDRIFVYSGNVEVKQGDMVLTSDILEGKYTDKNEIEQLTAKSNVLIVKGESIRANSEKAIYDQATESVTLTDNPELQQNGSVLTADTIKIFLKENRSAAEGSVRVKLINKDDGKQKPVGVDILKK